MECASTAARRTEALAARLRAAGCVFAEDEAAALLDSADGDRLEAMVLRREQGEPLEQVLGWADVDGVRVAAGPGVFVPRRRTALLARLAVEHLSRQQDPTSPGRLLDLCCGAAPVPALVLRSLPGVEVVACDVDPAATLLAARTLDGHPAATVVTGDLFEAVPTTWRGRADVVSANAPYVPTSALATMPAEARGHEPRLALDGGDDGLAVHRRIAAQVGEWLAPDGVLLVELAPAQVGPASRMFAGHGLAAAVRHAPDLDATALVVSVDSAGAPAPPRLQP